MNYTLKYISLAMLSALSLTACEDDNAIIAPSPGNPSTVPDFNQTSLGTLKSALSPGSDIVLLNIGTSQSSSSDPDNIGGSDNITFKLSAPLDHDVTLRIGMDPRYANNTVDSDGNSFPGKYSLQFFNTYHIRVTHVNSNEWHGLGENLTVNGEDAAIVTIKAGQIESEPINLLFKRQYLYDRESYLFPIEATDAQTGEVFHRINYIISPRDETQTEGVKPGVCIGYIDTEVMSPLIANEFIIKINHDDFNTFESTTLYQGQLIDIINVRTAFIGEKSGRPTLSFTADMEYVLKNRAKYIEPVQRHDIKVCLTIKSGNSRFGFSNLTDKEIREFVDQVKVAVDIYKLDGINLWDEPASYEKDGASPIDAASYAKLIKALKTVMPDKLLTMVDTRETTESLCDPVSGISVGDYLDYAWSSLEDFMLPYGPSASVRPLSGLPENKYATVFMRDLMMMSDQEMEALMYNPTIGGYLMGETFDPLHATDVVVCYDIPYNDYGKEGVWAEPWNTWLACKYPMPEDFSSMVSPEINLRYTNVEYYTYRKDW